MDTKYFFTDEINSDPDTLFRLAFTWLTESLEENEEAVLHIPQLTNLQGMLENFLGEQYVKQLRNKRKLIINGSTVHLCLDSNISYSPNYAKIFAYLAKSDQMTKIESKYAKISKILAIPWLENDLDEWKKTRNAQKLGENKVDDSRIVSNKVALCAIKEIAAFANKSDGGLHPSDKKMMIDVFKMLKKNKEPFVPNEIESWFILKAKWRPKDAHRISEIAQKTLDGKTVTSNNKMDMLKPEIIDTWRTQAKDSIHNSEEWRDVYGR